MRVTILFLFIILSCQTTNETGPTNNTNIWQKLKSDAPEETKQLGFMLGSWNIVITGHFRNGGRQNGYGTVESFIANDSLTIVRQYKAHWDGVAWTGLDERKFDTITTMWDRYFTFNDDPRGSHYIGSFDKITNTYSETARNFSDNYNEFTNQTRVIKNITANTYEVVTSIHYETSNVTIPDFYTAKFIRK